MLSIDTASEDGRTLANAVGFKNLCDSDYSYYHRSLTEDNKYLFIKEGRHPYTAPSGIGMELIIWPTHDTTLQPSQCFTIDDNLKEAPILTIVNGDACMEIRINGETQRKRTIKHFFIQDKELQNGYFLYLSNWPLSLNISITSTLGQCNCIHNPSHVAE